MPAKELSMKKINIELFRFNFEKDYLPYYRKYSLAYSAEDTMYDLLHKMNELERFSFDKDSIFRVNSYCMGTEELVSEIVKRYSNEIIIDTVSDFFAKDDLSLYTESYVSKLDIFDEYLSSDEKQAYLDKFKISYFASNSLNYNREYVGDHTLLVAIDLIKNRPELKQEILDLIVDAKSGIWYHTSLEDRVHNFNYADEQNIQDLLLNCSTHVKADSSKAVGLEKSDAKSDKNITQVSQDFSGFNIATYNGLGVNSIDSLVGKTKAKHIKPRGSSADLSPFSRLVSDNFSYSIAGDILLEAKDADADFILVKNEKTKEFFDKNQSKMEKAVGRDINLPVISKGQFMQLMEGERDIERLGFNSHNVKISFLD